MCGRYTVSDPAGVRRRFGLDERVEVRRRFNVTPGDEVLALTAAGPVLLRWGFLDDRGRGTTTINARAESLAHRPTWRAALDHGRCLIVADGFYEWRARQAHWITRADRGPFAFAGLSSASGTCAIVTTAAAAGLADLHSRMPVMLERDGEARWLAPQADLEALLRPFDDVARVAVGPAVNDARHDAPDCLDPAAPTLF